MRTATCPSGNVSPAINSGCTGIVDVVWTILRRRIDLHDVAENHKRWEGICEFYRKRVSVDRHRKRNRTEDADGGNKRRDIGELGDSGADDESKCPINDHRNCEEVLSSLDRQRRSMEQLHQDVLIDDFDANVPIQRSSNKTCGKRDCICRRL